jgi:predicted enzyme related to lactoylglutathione lyase
VIAVEDVKEHMKNVEMAGGKVLGEPWDIPGIGVYTYRFLTQKAIG